MKITKKMLYALGVLAWIAIISVIATCVVKDEKIAQAGVMLETIEYGKGVVYFDNDKFGENLAAYKRKHPNLKVTAIEQSASKMGYFVNFEDKTYLDY